MLNHPLSTPLLAMLGPDGRTPEGGVDMSIQRAGIPSQARVGGDLPGEHGSRRVIVVVEDNEDARETLCALLTLNLHETHSAGDGHSGLELILRVRPDVALVDIGLPGLTGYEVAHQLRAQGYEGHLIAVSGYGQPADVQRAKRAGFNRHMVKPVDPTMLEQMLSPQSD